MVETAVRLELRPIIQTPFRIAERLARGESGLEEEEEKGWGMIFNLNDNLTREEEEFGFSWIKQILGSEVGDAPVLQRISSKDNQERVIVFEKEIGNGWYLAKWHSVGSKPVYFTVSERLLANKESPPFPT